MSYLQKRRASTYLSYSGLFDGRNEDLRARTTNIVTTTAPHQCLSPKTMEYHDIPSGTLAMRDHAVCDGVWGTVYVCLECMDSYLDEMGVGA